MSLVVLLVIGLTRLQAEDYEGAVATATRAMHGQPANEITVSDTIYIHALRGIAYLLNGDPSNAIEDLNQAIDLETVRGGL